MRINNNERPAFTLVEIMIVVVIIGLLAVMALPAFQRVRETTQNTRFMNDARQFGGAIETFMLEEGIPPPDFSSGQLLPPLDEYIKISDWQSRPSIGGLWDVEGGDSGLWYAAVGVHNFVADANQILKIDSSFDDGDLGSGRIQTDSGDSGGSRLYWIIEE